MALVLRPKCYRYDLKMPTFLVTGPRDDFLRLPCSSSVYGRIFTVTVNSPYLLRRPGFESAVRFRKRSRET